MGNKSSTAAGGLGARPCRRSRALPSQQTPSRVPSAATPASRPSLIPASRPSLRPRQTGGQLGSCWVVAANNKDSKAGGVIGDGRWAAAFVRIPPGILSCGCPLQLVAVGSTGRAITAAQTVQTTTKRGVPTKDGRSVANDNKQDSATKTGFPRHLFLFYFYRQLFLFCVATGRDAKEAAG